MHEKTVAIPTMNCGHCVATIEHELAEVPGIILAKATLEKKLLTVRWKPPATWSQIAETLNDIGFPAEGVVT